MVIEKSKFLQRVGYIHLFNKGNANFLYSRENNHTYNVDDDIYRCLQSGSNNLSALKAANQLFNHIKRNIKPTANFYTLYILNDSNLESQIEKIRETGFTYNRAELVLNESDTTFNNDFETRIASKLNVDEGNFLIIKETKITLDVIKKIESGSNNNVRQVYDIGRLSKDSFSNLSNINYQIKLEYTSHSETEILKFINVQNYYLGFYIKDEKQLPSFLNFLLSILDGDPGINKRIYNIYAIANFIVSKVRFDRTIETYSNNTFSSPSNLICDNCWAKHICWATKTFEFFGVNLYDIDKYSMRCNSIRSLIENTISKLHFIEDSKKINVNKTYDFDGAEIKLIN